MKTLQKQFQRSSYISNVIYSKDGGKKNTKKTIIFDLDNTLVKASYKSHRLSDYDSQIYINILGNKRIKVSNYFSYNVYSYIFQSDHLQKKCSIN